MSGNKKISPLSDSEWPDSLADMRDGFAGGLNVYRTMARHPALLRAWAPLRQHVVRDNALGDQRSEATILRAGFRLGSSYEWLQHVARARACGMSDARIASFAGETAAMEPEDAVIARAVDELFDDHALSPGTRADLVALVGREGMFDVIATVGFYTVLGCILLTCGTPLDDDIAAELEASPPPATAGR